MSHHFRHLAMAFMFVFALTFVVSAAPITLVFQSHSSATNTATDAVTSNIGDQSVMVIPPNPAWYSIPGVPWVSHWQSGAHNADYVQVPNSTAGQTFSHNFWLPNNFVVTSATLKLLGDDTADAGLNGHWIVQPTDITPGPACIVGIPGCVASTLFTGSVNPAWFHAGMNNFFVDNPQLSGDSTGSSWKWEIEGNQVPEPATYGMMGLGLAALGLIARKRRQ